MKVAVIGIGGTGSAALRFLAEAGHEPTAFEQFAIGHDRGSSHGESRIIRYLYPDPLYTSLMRDAYPLWRDLESRVGKELLITTGGIFIGRADSSAIVDTRASLESAGCSYEMLDAIDAGRRFPDFRFGEGEAALYQEETGFLRASTCVRANVDLARAAGATVREGVRVESVEEAGGGVRIRCEGVDERFDRAIVTAGPWMRGFLGLTLPLKVTRQYVAYVGGEDPLTPNPSPGAPRTGVMPFGPDARSSLARGEKGRFPAWIDFDSPEMFYGIPHDGRIPGVKVAMHEFGPEVDPNQAADAIPASITARIEEYAAGRFRFESTKVTETVACLYTVTPDEDFVIESRERVTLVSGCSGHGFKFTVLLGKIAADLATGGDVRYDLSRFSVERFGAPPQ